MQQQFQQKRLHNAQQWRRFIMLWLTVILWGAFLAYMLLFHFQREIFEPLIMKHFEVVNISDYRFVEIKLFMYMLWSCCIVSGLAIINSWGKERRSHDGTPDKLLIVVMLAAVGFAVYYAMTDLNYLNGQLSFLANYF
ncbi:hypothetical protein GCM10007916_25520 [Psychromonas marina]|uniref:DUF4234 domain-containing protein n=1 Tax=Psychromonas marina TaxID=88364 RepID=A0ABQ6E2S5_9GAMM|nr:hypothetical protein [Psychromonas marina]GLS91483.1 hypothetical protein GCM10007916_25520 [Psychromonas marina]